MEYFRLNNSVLMPAIGSGTNTFGRDNDDLKSAPTGNFSAMLSALDNGFRFFDTAISYGNEEGLGKCLSESGIRRDDLFVLSKIPNRAPFNSDAKSIIQSVEDSLKRMQMDYFDVYMIHQAVDYNSPDGKMNAPVTIALYKVLEDLYKDGKFRALAVANFNPEQLQVLMDATEIVPACDQIRSNPALRNTETLDFCKAHGIIPMAHSPLNFTVKGFEIDADKKAAYIEKATNIGSKYGKSWGQVLLRQNYQLGICSIPKAHTSKYQQQNLDIFNFELTQQEMNELL